MIKKLGPIYFNRILITYFSDIDSILQCFSCYLPLLSIKNGRSSKFIWLHTRIQFFNIISPSSICIRWSIRNLSLNVLCFTRMLLNDQMVEHAKTKIKKHFRIQSQWRLANISTDPTEPFIGLLIRFMLNLKKKQHDH